MLDIGRKDVSSYASKRSNFEASPMLGIGHPDISSYVTKRAENFESDELFGVGSAYTSKRANFEASPMLDIGNSEESSYATWAAEVILPFRNICGDMEEKTLAIDGVLKGNGALGEEVAELRLLWDYMLFQVRTII